MAGNQGTGVRSTVLLILFSQQDSLIHEGHTLTPCRGFNGQQFHRGSNDSRNPLGSRTRITEIQTPLRIPEYLAQALKIPI